MHPSLRVGAVVLLAAFACAAVITPIHAQERFSLFVGSDPKNVDRMIRISGLRDDDVVVDLGSGDGRVVIGAALANPKLKGWGVDIDEKLVRESNEAAKKNGVADRVTFFHRNIFDADLREVSVVYMWLWPEMMRLIRPKIFAEMKPGSRVVTNIWDMGDWPPDQVDKAQDGSTVFLWVVPARVDGYWEWETAIGGRRFAYSAVIDQHFQKFDGVVRIGNRRGNFHDMKLSGDSISFTVASTLPEAGYVRHLFTGKVEGDRIRGSVRITTTKGDLEEVRVVPWNAGRKPTSGYFAPTGLTDR